jgi:putative Mg2+ transporter-C (MgtC) family protein
MPLETIIIRLAVAAGLGLLLGLERELHGRSAGIKTQVIVALASCLIMLISIELTLYYDELTSNSVVRLDPGRIASYAVAGMGFLGAGAIIQGKGSIQGLTTAACLWVGNAVGLAVGGGFYIPAALATVGVLLVLLLFSQLGDLLPRDTYLRIYMDFDTCRDLTVDLKSMLREYGVRVIHVGFQCDFRDSHSTYEVAIRLKSTGNWSKVIKTLRGLEGLISLKWTEGYVP